MSFQSYIAKELPATSPRSLSIVRMVKLYNLIFLWALLLHTVIESFGFPLSKEQSHRIPPAIFAFGDSLTDTGNAVSAFPFLASAEHPPYGSTFFNSPTGRFSDGRVIADFLASELEISFLQPYFSNIVPNYRHGINFAFSAATARNVSNPIPFVLSFQIAQFLRFKQNVARSLSSKPKVACASSHVPPLQSFNDGLYMIFIGINDLTSSLLWNGSLSETGREKVAHEVIGNISKAVQDLHMEGAKSFLVINIPAFGCIPLFLASTSTGPFNVTDKIGCLKAYNELVHFSNLELDKALSKLSSQLQEVKIDVGDIYAFMIEIIRHPSKYGFNEKAKFKACCGYGGDPYNYTPLVACGKNPAASVCKERDQYVSWDGIHFTEAFNERFVEQLMKGLPFLRPPTPG